MGLFLQLATKKAAAMLKGLRDWDKVDAQVTQGVGCFQRGCVGRIQRLSALFDLSGQDYGKDGRRDGQSREGTALSKFYSLFCSKGMKNLEDTSP